MTRPSGFYWVELRDSWYPAKWCLDGWITLDFSKVVSDNYFQAIGSRIEPDDGKYKDMWQKALDCFKGTDMEDTLKSIESPTIDKESSVELHRDNLSHDEITVSTDEITEEEAMAHWFEHRHKYEQPKGCGKPLFKAESLKDKSIADVKCGAIQTSWNGKEWNVLLCAQCKGIEPPQEENK